MTKVTPKSVLSQIQNRFASVNNHATSEHRVIDIKSFIYALLRLTFWNGP